MDTTGTLPGKVALGEAGATVYCTGRSTRAQRSEYDRSETIEETAELVGDAGGTGIAVPVDHLEPEQVEALTGRIDAEHGRLDVLVNDIWGGEHLFEWNKPLWEHAARLHGRGADTGLAPLGDDDGALRGDRGELARRRGDQPGRYLVEVQDAGRPADPTGYR